VLDVREAVICFQYAERVKSGLIIASRLIGEVDGMREDERLGAERLLISFLNALMGEIRIARNVLRLQSFEDASLSLERSIENVRLGNYDEAIRNVSHAISSTTTGGQKAAEALKARGIL